MFVKDGQDYSQEDIKEVYSRFGFVESANLIDFDNFVLVLENWFCQTGAIGFTSDREMRERMGMTEESKNGFLQIIKAFFYNWNFTYSSNLIENGKQEYQDFENSILDMDTQGQFRIGKNSLRIKYSEYGRKSGIF